MHAESNSELNRFVRDRVKVMGSPRLVSTIFMEIAQLGQLRSERGKTNVCHFLKVNIEWSSNMY